MNGKGRKFKCILAAFVILTQLIYMPPVSAAGTTYTVSTASELKSAIANASSGDIIDVTSNINVDKANVLAFENKSITIKSSNGSKLTRGSDYQKTSSGVDVNTASQNIMIKVGKNATLTLQDIVIDGNGTTGQTNQALVWTGKDIVTPTVTVPNSTIILNSGAVLQNAFNISSSPNGIGAGAIYSEGSVTINDGAKISGCKAMYGGALTIKGTFTMNGGEISSNTATKSAMDDGGAAVNLWNGIQGQNVSFVMNGGVIKNNIATNCSAGGVYLYYDSGTSTTVTFTMTGGQITGNYAFYYGGGVVVDANSSAGAVLNISGSATVNNNTASAGHTNNNIYLKSSLNKFNVTGSLSGVLGVISGIPANGLVVGQQSGYTLTASDVTAFIYDNSGFCIKPFSAGDTQIKLSNSFSAPAINTLSVPDGMTGTPYSARILANGNPSATFSITSGALQSGLSINPATGVISGTPVISGDYTFTVTATNSQGSDAKQYTLRIKTKEATPTASIDYAKGRITALTPNASYQITADGITSTVTANADGTTDATGYYGKTISILRAGNGSTTLDSDAQTLPVSAKPASPQASSFTVTDPADASDTTSEISGISSAYEYSTDGGNTWLPGSASDITVNAGNSILVRVKATGSAPYSDSITITTTAYTATPAEQANTAIATAKGLLPAAFTAAEGSTTNLLDYLGSIAGMSDTGVTLTLESSNANVSNDGAVTFTGTQVTGNVTVHIHKENGTEDTKTIAVTIPAHTATPAEQANAAIAAAKGLLPATLTAAEGTLTNLLVYLNSIAGMSGTGVSLTLDSDNANIADDGAVTYTGSAVTGSVTVHIIKSPGTTDAYVLLMTVPAHTPPALSHTSLNYDLNAPANVAMTIAWNGAASVTDAVLSINSDVTVYTLGTGDLSAAGNNLTIESSFIEGLPLTAGSALHFVFTFNTGDKAALTVNVVNGFVAVTGISDVPGTATANTPLTLTETIAPANATNRAIVWSVKDAGGTGASISGNTLSATGAGTVTIRATILNGASATTDYTQDFDITVNADMAPGILEEQVSSTVIHAESMFAPNAELIVIPIEEEEAEHEELEALLSDKETVAAFEVHVIPAGAFQPPLTLRFRVGTQYNGRTMYILHKLLSGETEQFTAAVANGEAVITVQELSPFLLAVDPQITITSQPQDLTVMVGQAAAFSVSAAGAEPLTYQWQKKTSINAPWENIEGAVNQEHTTSQANLSNNGFQYRVVITDALGLSVTSNAAAMKVIQPPNTGDDSQPALYLVLMFILMASIILLLRRRKTV